MSETVRLRATITWEYDAEPRYYGTSDPVAMAQIDQEGLVDDPVGFLDSPIPITVTVEVV